MAGAPSRQDYQREERGKPCMREIVSGRDRLEIRAQAEKAREAYRGCTVEETRNLHKKTKASQVNP